jgi:DsbC/DsbD-like thiol-disulfide interchange protein
MPQDAPQPKEANMARRRRGWLQPGSILLAGAALLAGMTLAPDAVRGQKSDSEVKHAVKAQKPDAAGKQTITIQLDVNPGWHIYSNPVGNEDLLGAQTEVKVTGKSKPASVKIVYPKGKLKMDKLVGDYVIYEGKVVIQAHVQRGSGDTGPLDVSIRFQACNDKGSCLFPSTVKHKVE